MPSWAPLSTSNRLQGRWEIESDALSSSGRRRKVFTSLVNTCLLPLTLAARDMGKQPGYLDLSALIFISSPEEGKKKTLHLTKLSNRRWFPSPVPPLVPWSLFHWKRTQVDVFLNGFDFITLLNDLARYLLEGELPRGAWPINV